MATGTVTLTLDKAEFECTYYADPGRAGTHWEPPELPELYIETFIVGGFDLTDMLDEWVVNRLNEMLAEHLERNSHEEE
jgi:hypothetical protein